ncbi:MAG: NifB/NifX family molybdenum-iron cluster-binding protein [Candidatus Glassbacteria bacterium]|nr:NifB/NifX family molybdenum-iron cluster-binding protein [Candidatus Glassbacteria bacterium]
MRIALSVYHGRISPAFDSSSGLLLVDLEDGCEVGRTEETLEQTAVWGRAAGLEKLGVRVLICGAISRPLACALSGSGVSVVPFTTGEIGEILEAYLEGRLPDPRYLMPGCCGRRRRFRRGNRG